MPAPPEHGPVLFDLGGKTYKFEFNNAGRMATEQFLDLEKPEIMEKIFQGAFGDRLMTGLFWGATRKFHFRQFPRQVAVNAFMDRVEDATDDEQEDFLVSLLAAYLRQPKEELQKQFGLDEEEEDLDGFDGEQEDDEPDSEAAEEEEDPKE